MSAIRTCTVIAAGLLAALVVPVFTGNQAPAATRHIPGMPVMHRTASAVVDSAMTMHGGTGMEALALMPRIEMPRF